MSLYNDPHIKEALEKIKDIPRTDHCVCCGSTNAIRAPLRMAGFVIERMLNTVMLDTIQSFAIQCQDCKFISSDFRFTDQQMQRYYHEYMQEGSAYGRQKGSYIFHRIRNEGYGWYDMVKLYKTPWWVAARKEAIVNVLKTQNIDLSSINSVLDFGGDLGQYIPDEFQHARRHVVEIEARTLVDGVTAVNDPADCEPVDLVICCHTLEHVSYPNDLVVNMKRYLKPGGLIYIEVPNEDQQVINAVNAKSELSMHEHINIFWPESLQALLTNNGFEVLVVGQIPYQSVHEQLDPARAIIGRLL